LTESDTQNSIRVALSPQGVVFRTNSGEFWQGRQIMLREALKLPNQPVLINLRRVQGLPKGFSDLLYLGFDGKAGFIEVKKAKGTVRAEQTNFLNLMRSYGYCAGIARSVNDALKIINTETEVI
jgi:hypothetical protein